MEKNTVETAENISRERKFQEDRLEGKKRMALELEKRDSELSNDIAKVQGISSKSEHAICIVGHGAISLEFDDDRLCDFSEIYIEKLIIFLEVLICRYSLYLQAFAAFFITEDVLKCSHFPSCFPGQK